MWRNLFFIAAAVLFAFMTNTAVCEDPKSEQAIDGCAVFPADNIWNTPIDTLPVASNSATYIATIGIDSYLHPDFGSGTWNGGPIGIPYVTVPGTQPKVAVSFEYADESDSGPYPIPTDAPIEGGPSSDGDRHVLIVDRDNCVLYELYKAYLQGDGTWQAGSGAIFDLKSNTLRPAGWTSADAAGLPILPGLVRYDEVASGEIKHAIRVTAPSTRREYVWPARHFASDLTGSQYPPMGQRFRLKAGYDLTGFSPEVQVILKALKKYGMILADNGAPWYITGVPDERWDNDALHKLQQIVGSDFEAVDASSLMANPDSGQVKTSLPGKAALGSPSGRIPDQTPLYRWNAVTGSTWYRLLVKNSSSTIVDTWFREQDICSGSVCAVSPATTLLPRNYTWWIRTWNASGTGPWSAGMNFSVDLRATPGKAALISPSGTSTSRTPLYRWYAVDGSTWYRLQVQKPGATVIGTWYQEKTVCSGAICGVTPSGNFAPGTYTWSVRTWNSNGNGALSSGMSFTVN